MSWLIGKLGPQAARILTGAAAIVLIVLLLALGKCVYDQKAKTEVRLAKGQSEAAIQSGHDAVEVLGNRLTADAETQTVVKDTEHEIQQATDPGAVTAAGRSGLCQLPGYKSRDECLQHSGPR